MTKLILLLESILTELNPRIGRHICFMMVRAEAWTEDVYRRCLPKMRWRHVSLADGNKWRPKSVPPWYSPLKPKPVYESNNAQAFWDVPLFAEHQEVRANRADAHIINHVSKRVITLEISRPWVTNRERKNEEKTTKYRPLRWELKQNYQGPKWNNIISWWTY